MTLPDPVRTGNTTEGFPPAQRTYIAIDLKSFYASVECVDRGFDPLTTNLVVADPSRTEKTICLAVSPSLKAYGIPGRARLFEVVEKMKEVNRARLHRLERMRKEDRRGLQGLDQGRQVRRGQPLKPEALPEESGVHQKENASAFSGRSIYAEELAADPSLEADYYVAVPRMAFYIEWSTRIYEIYLRYIAPEDIHVYSIDEVMMDVTKYLDFYKKTAHELAMDMIRDVLRETGITATAGIGTNLYLAKVAMDIEAKHTAPDADGVRIAELDERSYRRSLWGHRPITDFWRVGKGYARKLEKHGIFTMGDVARCSVQDEDLLYSLFGVNAELLIDHAWGWEPCTIDLIKSYVPRARSFSAGQVLQCPYDFENAKIVVREMADSVAMDLFEKRLTTDQLTLTVVYDRENLDDPAIRAKYKGPVKNDWYGRPAPKPAHGTANLDRQTSSARIITDAVLDLYGRITDPALLVRRIYLNTNHVTEDREAGHGRESARGQNRENRPADADRFKKILPDTGLPEDRLTDPGDIEREPADTGSSSGKWEQLDLFTDYEALEKEREKEEAALEKERRLQEAMLSIRKKFGKNAILKGTSLQDGATMRERNQSIGGHKA